MMGSFFEKATSSKASFPEIPWMFSEEYVCIKKISYKDSLQIFFFRVLTEVYNRNIGQKWSTARFGRAGT